MTVKIRYRDQPFWRRSLTVFSGVFSIIFTLGSISDFMFSNPDMAKEYGAELGDTRIGFLRAGMAFIMLVLAILSHLNQSEVTLFNVCGMGMLLTVGIHLVRDDGFTALMTTVLAIGIFLTARYIAEDS